MSLGSLSSGILIMMVWFTKPLCHVALFGAGMFSDLLILIELSLQPQLIRGTLFCFGLTVEF